MVFVTSRILVSLRIISVFFLLMVSSTIAQQSNETPSTYPTDPNWLDVSGEQPRRLPPVISDDVLAPPPLDKSNNKSKDNSMSMGMGMPGQRMSPLGYKATWFPAVPVSGQNTNFMMIDQSLSAMAPLGMTPARESSPLGRPAGGWMLSASVRNRSIDTDAIMPDTGESYPHELWNVSMGLMYFRKMDNGWSLGGGVNLGSASDRPFASINEMYVGMMAFLRIPSGERDAWMFSLMYAPMGELRFPIPGVAYSYSPSDDFRMNIGLPFSVMYRPIDRLTLEASYMPIHTIHAKAKYKLADWLSAFAAYDWANDSYALADRIDVNQRFFMYDQRLAGGLETTLGEHCFAELAAGLIFDRYSFEGKQWDTTQFNRVSFGSGPFLSLQIGTKF